jgi:hypothetical protein
MEVMIRIPTAAPLPVARNDTTPRARRKTKLAVWAGLLTPVPVLAVGVITAAAGENLRQYGMPWVLAAGAVLVRSCLAGPHHLGASTAGRVERVGHVLVSVGLLAVATFFAGLAIEDLLDTTIGSGRFLSDNPALSAPLTLLGSILSLVVLPVGLVLYGIAIAAARPVAGWACWLPLALPVIIVAGAATASLTGLPFVSTVWAALVAVSCVRLAVAVNAASRPAPDDLPTGPAVGHALITTPTNVS